MVPETLISCNKHVEMESQLYNSENRANGKNIDPRVTADIGEKSRSAKGDKAQELGFQLWNAAAILFHSMKRRVCAPRIH